MGPKIPTHADGVGTEEREMHFRQLSKQLSRIQNIFQGNTREDVLEQVGKLVKLERAMQQGDATRPTTPVRRSLSRGAVERPRAETTRSRSKPAANLTFASETTSYKSKCRAKRSKTPELSTFRNCMVDIPNEQSIEYRVWPLPTTEAPFTSEVGVQRPHTHERLLPKPVIKKIVARQNESKYVNLSNEERCDTSAEMAEAGALFPEHPPRAQYTAPSAQSYMPIATIERSLAETRATILRDFALKRQEYIDKIASPTFHLSPIKGPLSPPRHFAPSPIRHSPSPVRHRTPSPVRHRTPSPSHNRTPSPPVPKRNKLDLSNTVKYVYDPASNTLMGQWKDRREKYLKETPAPSEPENKERAFNTMLFIDPFSDKFVVTHENLSIDRDSADLSFPIQPSADTPPQPSSSMPAPRPRRAQLHSPHRLPERLSEGPA